MAGSDHAIAHGGTTLRQTRVDVFSVAEARYPPDLRVPVHTHAHAHVGFLLEGGCRETVSRRAYEYAPMDLIVKAPGESHSNRAGCRGARFLIVDVADEAGLAGVFDSRAQLRGGRLVPLAVRLREELYIGDDCSRLAIEGLLLELFAEIARARRQGDGGAPAWIERARELMHDGVAETRTLRQLAAEVGVHPAHFARSFRRHTGVTPGRYLRGLRVERALTLLADKNRTLAQVADEAGFCDQSHLTRVLRRETGRTPAAYRRGLPS